MDLDGIGRCDLPAETLLLADEEEVFGDGKGEKGGERGERGENRGTRRNAAGDQTTNLVEVKVRLELHCKRSAVCHQRRVTAAVAL